MSDSHRTFWQRVSWVVALLLGVVGSYAAMQQQRADAQRDAELSRLQVQELSVHNQTIDALRESAEHGYAILDARGLVKEWNPALEKWTGYTKSEMLGRNLEALMAREKHAAHDDAYARMIGDDASLGKTFMVACEMVPKKPGSPPVRVRVTARVVQPPSGARYAVALIDRERNVMEVAQQP